MTNAEKYLKDGVSNYEFSMAFNKWCFNNKGLESTQTYKMQLFLKAQSKPTLTEDERVILRSIKEDYITIARDKAGDLFIATERDENGIRGHIALEFKQDLFQFIKERRRIRDS